MDKRKWIIVGVVIGVVALVGVAVAMALTGGIDGLFGESKETRHVDITITNQSYGSVIRQSASGDYEVGTNPEFTFVPNNGKCIKSVKVDGVEVFDYLNNESLDVAKTFKYTLKDIRKDTSIVIVFDEQQNIFDLMQQVSANNLITESGDENPLEGLLGIPSNFGTLEIWGASSCFPKTGAVKLKVATETDFSFESFELPIVYGSSVCEKNADKTFEEIEEGLIAKYTSADQCFTVYNYDYVVETLGSSKKFKLNFKTREVQVSYLVYDEEHNRFDTNDPLTRSLYQKMDISIEYNYYYSTSSTITGGDVYLNNPITINGADDFFRLMPKYADGEGSGVIVIVMIPKN